jgi:hypothetical protein
MVGGVINWLGVNRSKGRPIIDTNSQEGEGERSPSLQEIYTEFWSTQYGDYREGGVGS